MSMRKVMKEIFVGTWKMIMKVFLRKKILGDISVEYLGNISGKNLKGVTEEIFVGYFEEDFGENVDHYNLFVDFNLQTNILKWNLKFILNLERVWEISRFEFLECYKSTPLKRNLVLEIRLRRVMGIALLQLHIFTLQLFEEMKLQQNLALAEHPAADFKRWFWLLKIIFRLLAFAWQLAYWRSIDANTQTFLLRTPTWIPFLIGLLVLHQLGWPLLI
jgi:hypothetical protein